MRAWDDTELGIRESEMTLMVAIWAATEACRQMEETAGRMAATLGRLGRVMRQQQRSSTTSEVHGAPCGSFDFRELAPDVENEPEVLTHATEPQDMASLKDDPPSRPL